MNTVGGFYVWNKGEYCALSPHFNTPEFTCPCVFPECVEQRIAVELINRLEHVRTEMGEGLNIARGGGFRCPAYQAKLSVTPGVQTVAAGGLSQHELGKAADPYCMDFDRLKGVVTKYFKAVGTGPHNLHVDLRDDRARRWSYL